MPDLTAQVTSGPLPFLEVTVQALGEDEINPHSVLRGKFSGGRSALAWLTCGPHLEVVTSVTGERLSAYRFSGVNEEPPTVRVVKEFSWQRRTGLLVGLEDAEGSILCLYDVGISRVVKAVVLPGRVTAIEPITNHGGASVSTQHLHQGLRWLFGVAAVATDVGHLLLVDLGLDDFFCSQNEKEASDLEVVTRIPAEVAQRRETVTREGRHLCFQLQNPSGTAISTLSYISRSNQLVVGFSDGYLSLWNMKTLRREHHSQLEGGRIPVHAVTFQEPENDPCNCCYLWAVQSTQESEGDVVSLHLLQLAFGDRRRLASGQVMYEGLEYCDERYSLDLTGGVLPLRGQTSNTKLLSCQTVEKFRNHVDREESINEAISPETSVAVFSWQVNTYGQRKPSTYLGVFDINRWYHAQMPDSLRPEEFLCDCPYFALWSLDAVVSTTSPNRILDILVHERSLSRGVPPYYPPPEQFFNPSTYSFDGTCLLDCGVVHVTCSSFRKETLNLLKSGPSISEAIHESYNRCLVAGLLSPRLVDVQPSSLSQEEQLEAVLSAAVQMGYLELLTGCIKHWTSEEQPSSAANLRVVLEWTWNKVIYTKHKFDQICVPLFDGSCNFTDPQTLRSLQHCQLLLSNLSIVLNCFLTEAQVLTEKGFADLTKKQVVTSLISLYVQVVIWFCRSSLLPEGLDDDMHLSRPFYNYPLIQSYYTGHRQKLERLSRGKWDSDCLMIDGMVSQLGDQVERLWRRDEGGTGKYPPTSLHALLDLYLLENIEESYKHAITIYLLLDIMHSFPNRTDTSIDSFPAAFAIPWGFVKLIQGFWLLDHNDYENSLALLFHPATVKTVSWQHTRIIQSLMCQGEHRRALRYLQMMKPSASSSSEVRLLLTVLLSNRCMVEAWTLLQQHTTKLTIEELLKHMYETCQEMGLMEDLLKLPFADTEQECLEKFLQSSGNVQNQEFLVVHHLQRANYIPALQLNRSMNVNVTNDCDPRWRERAGARNFILDQYGKILPRVQRRLAEERAKPYHLPSSAIRGVTRPKPLSTVTKQANTGNNVHTRATFISNVLSKIGEVWEGSEQKSGISRHDSPRAAAPPAATHPLPEAELRNAFVGTPVTTLSQKHSRSLGLVVCPVPSHSAVEAGRWQSPCRASTSFMASSPLRSNAPGSTSHKDSSGAAALTLLETPLVVKRAKVLATSAPGFPGFTTRSILRSSLRTTPPATPSASPGRSVTPPLRAKEPRISFREENLNTEGTLGVTEEDKTLSGASSEHHHGVVEDAWSESRDEPTLFTLSSPEDECAETEEPSESIPGDGWEEMDVSKEKSNFSARSDQTTLEYNDARSPGDFEDDVIFIAAKPANASPEETASFEDSERTEDDSEVVEDQPFQVEQLDSSEPSKVAGVVEEPDAECLNALPEDGKLVFKAAEAAISGTASEESEANHQESKTSSSSEEKAVSVATDPELSESPEAGRESVTSALDSEDVASAHSEHGVEGKRVDFPKDATLGAAEVEEDLPFPQEELTVSSNLPEAEVVSVIEDSAVKAPTLEEAPETSLYSDLAPSGNFQLSSDTTEQQLAWDLPDHKDGECDAAEGEGELFISPSNFSLVWEGEEGEAEMGDAASVDASKPAGTTEEKPGENLGNTENQEHVTNSVSTVTSDQESQNTAESLPYVPEPIKVAIAENLLDVIKDTRSKEFTAEVVEQSIHETIGKKVTRFRKAKAPLTVPEGAEDEASQHQAEHVITPRTCTRGQLGRRLTPSAGRQQLLRADKPLPAGLSPRRSTRRMREASETEASAQGEQMPVLPVTPRRGGKLKAASAEKVASSHSDGQTLSVSTQPVAVTPRRGLRRAKEAASELLEGVNEETSLAEDSIIASATSRRTRGGKSSAGEQETGQTDTDRKVKTAVSPSRSARKLKSINLQLTENPVRDQGAQPSDQLLSPAPAKRGRRRKRGSSEVSENSDLDPSESLLPQTEFKLPVTPRRSARKATQNYLADTESLSTQEDINSGGRIEILGTPRRRITRVSHAEPAKTDAHEETRTEASTPPRTAVRTGRRGRKRRSILEESTGEEAFPPGPEGTPLLPKDTTPLGRDEAPRTSTDRVPRRSSRKTATHQKLSVEGKESFLFSPPLTKLTKKSDGKAEEPVQLKDLDPDLSSQFVFSPPLLRSRRKNVSSISQIVKEPELPTKGEEDSKSVESVGKQKSRRGRTAKSKMKKANKTTRKEGSWSPPPAEIKFISPFPSPVAGTKSKQKETAEAAEKNLRKNKRRLSNFPKPVVRRKML